MYSYVMLCAIRDALESHIKTLYQQWELPTDLNAAHAALALTRSQLGSHIAEHAGRGGTPAEVPPGNYSHRDGQGS